MKYHLFVILKNGLELLWGEYESYNIAWKAAESSEFIRCHDYKIKYVGKNEN